MCIVGNLCWIKRLSHSLTSGGCELEKSLMCSLARDSTAVLLCSYRDSPTVYHCTHIKPRLSGVYMCSFGEFISGDTLSRLQHFGFFRNVQLLKILPESSPRKDTITSCVFPRWDSFGDRKKNLICILFISKASWFEVTDFGMCTSMSVVHVRNGRVNLCLPPQDLSLPSVGSQWWFEEGWSHCQVPAPNAFRCCDKIPWPKATWGREFVLT